MVLLNFVCGRNNWCFFSFAKQKLKADFLGIKLMERLSIVICED